MAQKKTGIVKASPAQSALARPMEAWEIEAAEQAKSEVAHETIGLPRINKDGHEIKIDGKTVEGNKLRLVIVDYIFTHTYFKNKYQEGVSASPDCYAYGTQDNGLVPHESSKDKQCATCDACPHFAFGSNPESPSGKGKRCPGGRKLAVIMPSGDTESLAAVEMRVLTVNGGSLQNWGRFVKAIPDVSPSGNVRTIITEVGTERKGQVYVWTFKAVDRLGSDLGPKVMDKKFQSRAREALLMPWPTIEEEEKPQAKRRAVKGQ